MITLGARDFSSAVSGFYQVFSRSCAARGFGLRPKMSRPSANTEDSRRTREKPVVPRVWIDQPQPETPHLIPLPRDVLGHRRQHVFRHHVLEKTSSVVLRYILSCHTTTTRSLFLVTRNVSQFLMSYCQRLRLFYSQSHSSSYLKFK